MHFALIMFLLFVISSHCILVIALDAVMVAINCIEWIKFKRLHVRDKIFTCLGLSRSFFLLTYLLTSLFSIFVSQNYLFPFIQSLLLAAGMLFNLTYLWSATALCVFYCIKILNCNHALFLYVKTRISKFISYVVCVSLVVSLPCSLMSGWNLFSSLNASLANHTLKYTTEQNTVSKNVDLVFYLYCTGSSLPFVIFCIAIFLLIRSVWMHVRQMKNSQNSFRSPNFEVLLSVVKSMICFIVLYMIILLCLNLSLSELQPNGYLQQIVCAIVFSICNLLLSLNLIYINKKLKLAFLDIYHCLMTFFVLNTNDSNMT
ncbi:taste receptor type 2 member 40-like [Bombina bombina]|uniref:taste receptor type 2 member 40-like n=1 Tax=Bombina bombina TaxID=8345 RepID=UPI00235AF855|nr:taste receptor type 2 member 40-like [Bombina bombina]